MRITISILKKYTKTTKATNKLTWLLLGRGWSKRNLWEGRMVGYIWAGRGGMHSKWWLVIEKLTRRNFSDDATVNAEWIKMTRDMHGCICWHGDACLFSHEWIRYFDRSVNCNRKTAELCSQGPLRRNAGAMYLVAGTFAYQYYTYLHHGAESFLSS